MDRVGFFSISPNTLHRLTKLHCEDSNSLVMYQHRRTRLCSILYTDAHNVTLDDDMNIVHWKIWNGYWIQVTVLFWHPAIHTLGAVHTSYPHSAQKLSQRDLHSLCITAKGIIHTIPSN